MTLRPIHHQSAADAVRAFKHPMDGEQILIFRRKAAQKRKIPALNSVQD